MLKSLGLKIGFWVTLYLVGPISLINLVGVAPVAVTVLLLHSGLV